MSQALLWSRRVTDFDLLEDAVDRDSQIKSSGEPSTSVVQQGPKGA